MHIGGGSKRGRRRSSEIQPKIASPESVIGSRREGKEGRREGAVGGGGGGKNVSSRRDTIPLSQIRKKIESHGKGWPESMRKRLIRKKKFGKGRDTSSPYTLKEGWDRKTAA